MSQIAPTRSKKGGNTQIPLLREKDDKRSKFLKEFITLLITITIDP